MRIIWLGALAIVFLAACGQSTAPAPDLETAQPYWTFTPSQTYTPLPALTNIQFPTPTFITYTVTSGDTLAGIAARFGVTLEALLQANPGIQPDLLVVGAQLTIPAGMPVVSDPTPTPARMAIHQAKCWPETAGGLWCFALVQNEYPEPLESISAQFALIDENGNEIVAQVAYAPLDILAPGAFMPLGVYFPPPVDLSSTPRVQVLTAIRLLSVDTGYLPVMLDNIAVTIDANGRSAVVTGRLLLTILDGRANSVRVLAIAYAADGQLVGFRRWEAGEPLNSGEYITFDVLVSSMGPEIDHIEFLTEAHP